MSRYYTSDGEASSRRTASAPNRLTPRTTTQHPAAPRQAAPTLLQSPAALRQQYMSTISGYPPSSSQYTTSRPSAATQRPSTHNSKPSASSYTAVNASHKARTYSRKRILLVWFQNHDFSASALTKEVTEVAALFSDDLGFESPQSCLITESDTSPTNQLITALKAFTRACKDKKELLVVYYSGHGRVRPRGGLNLQGEGKAKDDEKVYWNRIQKEVLFKVDADFLVLLDCCYAEMGVKGLHRYRRDSIAACAKDRTTATPGERSFTECLLQAARQLLPHGGFTVQQLFDRIRVVAAEMWYDGAKRAETPIYKDQCGDETEHEIHFEMTSPPTSAPDSASAVATMQPAAGNRRRTSTRRDPSNDSDESSNDSEEDSEGDEEEDEENDPPQTTHGQAGASDTAWQQRRAQAQAAWKRMWDEGRTPEEAFEKLVATWQTSMHLSKQDADAQIRWLLAR
ncbi:hypothetical protein M409DRAFT_50927 [Zasmidium cellare ATCC 36951]|uniref:Uncharacterized protein n=1 Tax=Zasmidium cellare ATCC 36951 TaxID=1080233 RepID=A0A6A6CXQ2_ZASCE|nr:uncharacterized protein M409DRAFT_50927 [Zasmidium cellare ATCC 36951]KAF2171493.1 hypothetical protein M409DRAFT_50927 [Zasmidium cellare ATCC 36951]